MLPDGKTLRTLRDAIHHLAKTVPKRERNHPAVLLAATIVSNAAEGRDFVFHARVAVMKALNRHEDPAINDNGLRGGPGRPEIRTGSRPCANGVQTVEAKREHLRLSHGPG